MRIATKGLKGLSALILLAATYVAVADEPVDVSSPRSPGEAIAVGEALEDASRWAEAIEFYENVLERWQDDSSDQQRLSDSDDPDLEALEYALRRSRVHFGIDRRYIDESFGTELLRKSRSQALDLLEDVLSRVQMEYFKSISAKRFVAHGTESFYMALSNDRFVRQHLPGADDDAIDSVKGTLIRDYWNRPIGSQMEARSVVNNVCDLAHRELGIRSSAVIMEYIFGGCNALDEYSHLLTPNRYNDLTGSIQGEFVGIGIEMVARAGDGMELVRVLEESPAEEGGLHEGDYIVSIDGRDCRDFSTDEAARLLRGVSGSRVTLGFESEGTYQEGSFVRRAVQVRSITKVQMLDREQGIGYFRQTGFQSSTVEELDAALSQLHNQGMKSLVWDLRKNPGGLLDVAARVLDRFIDNGVLVSTKGRTYDQNQTFTARSWSTHEMPLVLLVDKESASASEIVAGAIRDHKRGQIVGEKTYGKWSVQSIIHMPGGTGLKLTTAKFYSPNNINYSGKGLPPDVEVEAYEVARRGLRPNLFTDQVVAEAIDILSSPGYAANRRR